MPHLEPLHWDASPQFRERFGHCQTTRGLMPNSILTLQRRPAIDAVGWQAGKHGG